MTAKKKRSRGKKFEVGEQEKAHRLTLHLPIIFFGKGEQVEKSVERLVETLRIKGYVVGEEWFYGNRRGPITVPTEAPEIETGDGSP